MKGRQEGVEGRGGKKEEKKSKNWWEAARDGVSQINGMEVKSASGRIETSGI